MEHVKHHQAKAALDLYRVLSEASSGNVFLSPFSVSTVLSMTYGGAAGKTAKELQKALSLPDDAKELHDGYKKVLLALEKTPNVTLETANRIYIQKAYEILDEYGSLLKGQYRSELKSVDFGDAAGTSKLINDEVASLTKDKIKDLIPADALGPLVRLVLVNAIYFKGFWKEKFDPQATDKRDFFITPDNVVKTDMMYLGGKKFNAGSSKDLDCKVLELPYEGRRFVMVIALPNQKDGLKAMESKLTESSLQAIRDNLKSMTTEVSIPKFKMEITYDLIPSLQKLGISDLFDQGAADLSGISGKPDLFVSKVVHKAFIDVNEEGSEAAAATGAVMMMRCALVVDNFEFIADHPFMFFIIDNETGLSLFSGRYVQPPQ